MKQWNNETIKQWNNETFHHLICYKTFDMRCKKNLLLFLCAISLAGRVSAQAAQTVDVCVYGGTSAGIIAAYTASKMHKTVVLVEPGQHLGGLTTGGLGYTDIGNKYAITGLSRNFYRQVGKHYGRFEQWIFEPSVAGSVFRQYLQQASVQVQTGWYVTAAAKQNGRITSISVQQVDANGVPSGGEKQIRAKMFIDCSYEGDLMAKAGVSYIVGREANSVYNETYNGVQLREKHQFPDGIDPYKIPGNPGSGLLWGISAEQLAPAGSGDKKVQAYNFRICLTDDPSNRLPITRPDDYDSSRYELLLRVLEKKPAKNLWGFLKFDLMPNHKTDINNNGPFSTDMIGMNYDYAEADFAKRQQIIRAHESYTKGLLYFIGHDSRMPEHLRNEMLRWGYPKDEYTASNHWSPQLYVREARRMIGAYVMTQANCEGREKVEDAIGLAAYTMDSHNCQRVVVNGMVKNEGDVQIGGFGPYPIAYRAITPKAGECANLLVPVCLSASHIAYGSIRMEPVFMALAQAASTAAVLAIDENKTVQQVDARKIRATMDADPLVNGSTPEILVDNDDATHVTVQGSWKKDKAGAYGASMYVSSNDINTRGTEANTIRFTPEVVKAGRYHVYSYVPKLQQMAPAIPVSVFDGRQKTTKTIDAAAIKVEGQTSGEWVDLGEYRLPKGKSAYVEISAGTSGPAVADAIIFVPAE